MPKVTDLPDGTKRIETDIPSARQKIVLYSNRNFEDVVVDTEKRVMDENFAKILKDARSRYEVEYKKGNVDGSLYLNASGVVGWFMSLPDFETLAEREAREAAERQALDDEEAGLKSAE